LVKVRSAHKMWCNFAYSMSHISMV